jgi:hypothetical protein
LSTRFFSNRDVEQDSPSTPLERQQLLLLAALRHADGAPISYSRLRDAGIEFPAGVVSELELMGVQIERCYEHAERRRHAVGVRLDPEHADRAISCDPSDVRAPGPLFERMPASRRPTARLILAASMLVALVLVTFVLVTLGVGHSPTGRHARSSPLIAAAPNRSAPATPSKQASSSAAQTQQPQPPQIQPKSPPGATRVSATLAVQLEAHGHELLQTGQSASAVPVLEHALVATGESIHGCEQPSSEQCLTYAYALYDLGRALLLSGSPAAAVGVLEHRLQIENQQPVVAAELASARHQLG